MSDRFAYTMPMGTRALPDGTVRFAVRVPAAGEIPAADRSARDMSVLLEGASGEKLRLPLSPEGDGRGFSAVTAEARAGMRYWFERPDGTLLPDPASRRQAHDVNGPSIIVDPLAYRWQAADWTGRPWEETILYTLHVGAFTPEGSFAGVAAKLDHLQDVGVTAVELMPVSEFPGRWGWGDDSALPFAPECSYGEPEALKALVDELHGRGLSAFLRLAPIADAQALVHAALYWVQEYRIDGLRLDTDPGVMAQVAEAVRRAAPDRQVHLIAADRVNRAWQQAAEALLATGGEATALLRAWTDGPAPTATLALLQGPDQIAGRPGGARLAASVRGQPLRALTAILLLAPPVPQLFMGDEWGALTPFPRFHGDDEEAAFKAAVLDWENLALSEHEDWLGFVSVLLRLRQTVLARRFVAMPAAGTTGRSWDGAQLSVQWVLADRTTLSLAANLGPTPGTGHGVPPGELLFDSTDAAAEALAEGTLPAWSACWFITDAAEDGP